MEPGGGRRFEEEEEEIFQTPAEPGGGHGKGERRDRTRSPHPPPHPPRPRTPEQRRTPGGTEVPSRTPPRSERGKGGLRLGGGGNSRREEPREGEPYTWAKDYESGGLKMVPAPMTRNEWALTWERADAMVSEAPAPPPGLEGRADLDPEVVVSEKTGDVKGIMDVWPEDVKAMLAAGQFREEAIRAAELPKLPELGAKEAGPLAAGDWLAEIKPIMMDLSTSAAVWWEHIMNHAERAYQKWLDMRPVDRLNVAPEEPGWLGKYPCSRVEQRGAGLLLRALPQGLRQEVVSRRTLSAAGMVFKVLTMYQPGGRKAEPPQLLGGAKGEWKHGAGGGLGGSAAMAEVVHSYNGAEAGDAGSLAAAESVG